MNEEYVICPHCGNKNPKNRSFCTKCGKNIFVKNKKINEEQFNNLIHLINREVISYSEAHHFTLKERMQEAALNAASKVHREEELYKILKAKIDAFFDFNEAKNPVMGIYNYYVLQIVARVAKSDNIITKEESMLLYQVLMALKKKLQLSSLTNKNVVKEIMIALLKDADRGLLDEDIFLEFLLALEVSQKLASNLKISLYKIALATAYIDGDFSIDEKIIIKKIRSHLDISQASSKIAFKEIRDIFTKKY